MGKVSTDFGHVDTTGKLAGLTLDEAEEGGFVGVGVDHRLAEAATMAWKVEECLRIPLDYFRYLPEAVALRPRSNTTGCDR